MAKAGKPFTLTANLNYPITNVDKSKIIWKKRMFSKGNEDKQSYIQFVLNLNNDGEQIGTGHTIQYVFKKEDESEDTLTPMGWKGIYAQDFADALKQTKDFPGENKVKTIVIKTPGGVVSDESKGLYVNNNWSYMTDEEKKASGKTYRFIS